MKRFFCLMMLVMLCIGGASAQEMADCVYLVQPAECNMDKLKELAFGEKAGQAVLEKREYGYQHYDLPEAEGVPFCGAGPEDALLAQARISIYCKAGEAYQFEMTENVCPDGTLPQGMLTADEARAITEAIPPALGLEEPQLLSTTTYGRMLDSVPGYKMTYLQRLNGLPVYWGAAADRFTQPESNLLQICVDGRNGELCHARGMWSRFTPAGNAQTLLDTEKAHSAFQAIGMNADRMERCYWMMPDPGTQPVKAYPAYRVSNTFLNAITGEWLQTD